MKMNTKVINALVCVSILTLFTGCKSKEEKAAEKACKEVQAHAEKMQEDVNKLYQ